MSDFLPDARAVVRAVYGKQCQAAAEWRVKPSAVSNWISRNRLPPRTEHRIKLKLLAEGMSAPDHLWQRPSRDLSDNSHAEAV